MDTHKRFPLGTIARILVGALISSQFAYAASTDISDTPMAVKNMVAPNIMFTLDNSGSMDWEFMPDDANNLNSKWGFKSSQCNAVYYNPAVTYTPPVDADGKSYANASFTSAKEDGYDSGSSTRNLSSSFKANSSDSSQAAYYYNYSGTEPAMAYTYDASGNVITTSQFYQDCNTDSGSSAAQKAKWAKVTVSSTSAPPGIDGKTNFANWYSYYRTRILMMKTALGQAFSILDSGYRVGFSTINSDSGGVNNSGDNFLNIKNFDTTQKTNWYSQLYAVQPNGSTPLQEALRKDGEYYLTGTMPGASGSTDPIQKWCQQNYTILSTDGFWNGTAPSVGDWDKNVPALPAAVTGLTTGSLWPSPFWQGATATSNTLADVAMKYWATDLRTSMDNNLTPSSADPAKWQHMTTYTIGLASGTLPYPSGLPTATSPNWPAPSANDPSTIDDLWHAAVNGHGTFLSAKDPVAVTNSLTSILHNIIGRTSAGAEVAVSNPNLTAGDNFAYSSSYSSGTWSGDLQAYPINLSTGEPDNASPMWAASAATQLDTVATTHSNNASGFRYIATYTGAAGVPFLWASLTTTQQNSLNSTVTPPGTTDGAAVLAYIRGDRTKEGIDYRSRAHLLGDIIHSAPVVVREPMDNFADAGYSTYKTANSNRAKTIYQGANDGMLHAFDAATGAELWAYVPSFVIPNLNNLSRKTGFTHKYYVGATPVAADVDFSYPAGTDWRTILVGGLGKGGRGYYALNVTTPTAGSDTAVAGKVLWEFPNNSTNTADKKNIGYSYGKPIIAKTEAAGWVVLVTSGYNNGSDTGGDGKGHLFVLNAKTGALIQDIVAKDGSTNPGSSTTPSGLAQISAFSQNADIDGTIEYVYGGDLQGNVWRFDLTGNSTGGWNVKKLATLVDASGNYQPITTAPELGQSVINGVAKRFIYVGTGQYLGDTDIPGATGANSFATQTQTMYALVDDLSNNPTINPLRSTLQQQVLSPGSSTRTLTTNPVNYATKKGWYVDFPSPGNGERVVNDPILVFGSLVFTTLIPSSDSCLPGGTSWLYAMDYQTGGQLSYTVGGAGKSLGSSVASGPVGVNFGGNGGGTTIINNCSEDGKACSGATTPPGSGGTVKRISWRELTD